MLQTTTQHSLSRLRPYFVVAALAFACVVGLAMQGAGSQASSDTSTTLTSSVGDGTLTIAGSSYDFVADACAISDSGFVASGFGTNADEQFRITASISSINLALGTSQEFEQPDSDTLWLQSDEPPLWWTSGPVLFADVSLVDPRDPESTPLTGTLRLSCESAQ